MITSNTIQYKSIFPTLEKWKTWINGWNNYNYQNSDTLFYNILNEHYANAEIAYDTTEAFKRHFITTYRNVRDRYMRRNDVVNMLNTITPSDLIEEETTVNVASFNNATALEDPLGKINPYVDAQNATKTTTSKLDRYVKYLNALPDNFIYEFVNEFQHHFISVIVDPMYLYRR